MASTYTDIGTELMTTGENASTWGTKTNTNLKILEEAIRGYVAQSIAGGADTTALTYTDGTTGDAARNMVIALTGTITGNQVVTVTAKEKVWIVDNQTSGAYTVQFMVSGQTGVTWATTDKGTKILYCNGTDVIDTGITSTGTFDLDGGELTLDADSDTSITASTDDQIDFEIAGADDFTMTANAFNVLTGSHATFADSANAKFGTGNDMLMYHDGSNSYITNATGALKIATETSGIALTIGHTTSETTIADNLTVTGDADIDGTTNLDAVDIDGAVQIDGAITVGVDDTGLDVKLFGASAGAYMEWDESIDTLRIVGASADATTSTGKLLLATSLTDINASDVIGKIDFQAPLEAGGTDAITVAASIQAMAQATFSSSVNATDLLFFTGHSEAATEKFRFTSQGEIGVGGANYGTDGQVLTSGGAGAAPAWEDTGAGAVTALNNATQSELVTVGSTTTELDAEANLTFTGSALTCIGTITVGVDNTGHDVKYFGATSGSYWLWDESADGVVQIGGLTVGVDDAGHDVKFFGDAASAFMLWDASTDDLVLGGAAKLYLYDAGGGENISSDGSTLSIAGGGEIDLTATAIDINGTCDVSGTLTNASTAVNVAGTQTMWVPANAMTPTTSNGCAAIAAVETTSGRPDMYVLDFDKDSDEFAQFAVAFPKSWNLGTVTFQVFWSGIAATSDVDWSLEGVGMPDNSTIDVAYGTAVVVTDNAQGAVEELLVSAVSGAVTIAGTPADDDLTYFRIGRDVSGDAMSGDARLHGVKIFYTTDAKNDA